MKNELREIFAQGDRELCETAGETATLVRGSGERVTLRAVISPAERGLRLPSVTGAMLECDRSANISKSELTRPPVIGNTFEAGGAKYEILRVVDWPFDASWHVDLALRA